MAQTQSNNSSHAYQLFTQRNLYQQHHHHQRNRLIAPASQMRLSHSSSSSSVYAAGTTLASNNPAVVRRNARERNRVKQVNNGFLNLRQHIPTAIIADLSNGRRGIGPGANKKLSKVDTLRMAVEYIRRLQHVIDEVDSGSDASSVSSFNGSSSSSSGSSIGGGSPQHENFPNHHYMEYQSEAAAQRCYSLSYAGSFPPMQQQNHQSNQFNSSAASYSPTDSYSISPTLPSRNTNDHQLSLKSENSYDEYTSASTDDDEELLDYISLWQGDM